MPELRFIDRDKITGKICGTYACKQREGQESLWDDCAEMQEFAARLKQEQEDAQNTIANEKQILLDRISVLESKLNETIAVSKIAVAPIAVKEL